MTFLPLPCFPSFRASRWALAGNPREQSLLMELTALEGAAICVEGASDTEGSRGQRGPNDWQRVPCGEPRREQFGPKQLQCKDSMVGACPACTKSRTRVSEERDGFGRGWRGGQRPFGGPGRCRKNRKEISSKL